MSELTEKIAYLRGLAEGMKLDKETNEGKLISEIIDVLGDMGADVDSLFDIADDLEESVADLEEAYDEIEEELFDEYEDEDDDEDDIFVINCPSCGVEVALDDDILSGDAIICPNCEEEIEIEFDCDCDEECSCCDSDCE
ncbi:MAG: hypothetical protein PHE51_06045 [Eubacteriales bacterium]|nr:hypothetical protein [Eubacteriales bacterium]